jgi:hypothetical protein
VFVPRCADESLLCESGDVVLGSRCEGHYVASFQKGNGGKRRAVAVAKNRQDLGEIIALPPQLEVFEVLRLVVGSGRLGRSRRTRCVGGRPGAGLCRWRGWGCALCRLTL